MSTTFDAYPRTWKLPSFEGIINHSTVELHRFLDSEGIRARPRLHWKLYRSDDWSGVHLERKGPARWDKDVRARISIGGVIGEIEAFFEDDRIRIPQRWDDEFENPRNQWLEPLIRKCTAVGFRWSFRRSAFQPASINLAYGLVAESVAAVSEGFLTSDDGAWESERLPALPQEFFSWYFRPEKTSDKNYRRWVQNCLDRLSEELGR